MKGESVQGLRAGRHVGRELRHGPHRPAPPLCRFDRARVVEGRADEARKRPDRRVVRLGSHALRPGALSVPSTAGSSPGSSPPTSSPKASIRPAAGSSRCTPSPRCSSIRWHSGNIISNRPGARQERQQDVETPGQCRRSVRGARHLRRRRHALVHDLQLAAVGTTSSSTRTAWTRCAAKFFGTLYNTYSFFALCANVDGFTGREAEVPMERRPEIDRWIVSLLHTPRGRRDPRARKLRPDARRARHPGVRGREPLELVRAPPTASASGAAA